MLMHECGFLSAHSSAHFVGRLGHSSPPPSFSSSHHLHCPSQYVSIKAMWRSCSTMELCPSLPTL